MRALTAFAILTALASPVWADSIVCTSEEVGTEIVSRCEIRADKARLERAQAELRRQLDNLGKELEAAQAPSMPAAIASDAPADSFSDLVSKIERIDRDATSGHGAH